MTLNKININNNVYMLIVGQKINIHYNNYNMLKLLFLSQKVKNLIQILIIYIIGVKITNNVNRYHYNQI